MRGKSRKYLCLFSHENIDSVSNVLGLLNRCSERRQTGAKGRNSAPNKGATRVAEWGYNDLALLLTFARLFSNSLQTDCKSSTNLLLRTNLLQTSTLCRRTSYQPSWHPSATSLRYPKRSCWSAPVTKAMYPRRFFF